MHDFSRAATLFKLFVIPSAVFARGICFFPPGNEATTVYPMLYPIELHGYDRGGIRTRNRRSSK